MILGESCFYEGAQLPFNILSAVGGLNGLNSPNTSEFQVKIIWVVRLKNYCQSITGRSDQLIYIIFLWDNKLGIVIPIRIFKKGVLNNALLWRINQETL